MLHGLNYDHVDVVDCLTCLEYVIFYGHCFLIFKIFVLINLSAQYSINSFLQVCFRCVCVFFSFFCLRHFKWSNMIAHISTKRRLKFIFLLQTGNKSLTRKKKCKWKMSIEKVYHQNLKHTTINLMNWILQASTIMVSNSSYSNQKF